MRHVLVDFARQRLAQRGKGEAPSSLDEDVFPSQAAGSDPEMLVQIGMLMEQLEEKDLVCTRTVDMHYFVGFTLEEIAEITGFTFRQVRHRWEKGRDWLKDRL
jgi:DNA-directed RNA polymerase specialized sigma24 family protein